MWLALDWCQLVLARTCEGGCVLTSTALSAEHEDGELEEILEAQYTAKMQQKAQGIPAFVCTALRLILSRHQWFR